MEPTKSRLLGRRLVAVGVAALLGCALAFAFAPAAHADPNVDEAQFLADLNLVRAKNGVPPLATDGQLINVARAWSAQMAGAGALNHNPDLGSQVSNWRTLGENIGTGSDVATVEAALEASPHHFQNMVDPAFQYVGIGVVEAGGSVWVTEDFKQAKSGTGALPSTAVPAPAPKPSAPKPPAAPRPAPAPAPARPSSAAVHKSAASPAAAADAGAPSANATLASATPAPNTSPPSGSGPAKSQHQRTLPKGLAIVSGNPVVDGPRFASLALFAVLGAAVVLATHGRLPGMPRLGQAHGRGEKG